MKSLLISALAMGAAFAEDSAYYIGNYTASGQTNLVPYPLGVCVPTGAISSFTYSIFQCAAGDVVEQKKYASTDTTCSGSYTTVTLPKNPIRGLEGYTNCEGPISYMSIGQYLSSCQNWYQGKDPIATTVVAADACTLSGIVEGSGAFVYSRTTCDGDNQQVQLYLDATCATIPLGDAQISPNECHFFNQQGSFQIYSAISRCVIAGVEKRCTNPLTSYEAVLTFDGVATDIDYNVVYQELFEYATVATTRVNGSDNVYLNLDFCSAYEDQKYASAVADLGQTTLTSDYISDTAEICWTCLDFECRNQTLCGNDDYCVEEEQCVGSTTTTESSASVIYASFTLMMGLLLSSFF